MQIDPRLAPLGITVVADPTGTWVLTSAMYQDDQQSGGNHNIYFTVQSLAGIPLQNVTCVVDWVGRDPSDSPTRVTTDQNGKANVPIWANLDIHLLNGPYFAYVDNPTASDMIKGMGLPENTHVNYLLTFTPRPVTPPPPPTLQGAVLAAAESYRWMPINTGAALYKFAQAQNLGYPQTDEFELNYGGIAYVAQVYNLGIVYVKKGDWGNVQWMNKPS